MCRTVAALPLSLLIASLSAVCQDQIPTVDDPSALGVKGISIEVITPDGTSIQFIREKPRAPEDKAYYQADAHGVLTLVDGCLRLGEDGPVIIWPPNFTPQINGRVLEVRNIRGRVVAKLGEPLSVGGALKQRDAGNCSGPIWIDTQVDEPAGVSTLPVTPARAPLPSFFAASASAQTTIT